MRSRLLALALLLPLAVLAGCGDDSGPEAIGDPAGLWSPLPSPPLKPTLGPVAAWTGSELLVIGGDPAEWCPLDADCAGPPRYSAAGAAYSFTTKSWRALADAPEGIPDLAAHALVGELLYVKVGAKLLSYDVRRDTWSSVAAPDLTRGHEMTSAGRRLVFTHYSDEDAGQPDLVYDTANKRWSRLPDDPLGSTHSRSIAVTPHGWVLTALVLDMDPGADGMPPFLAARYDLKQQRWTRLPDADTTLAGRWVWAGTRLVLVGGGLDANGESEGTGLALDPVAGHWSVLRDQPAGTEYGWPVDAANGPVIAAAGWLYDDRTEHWRSVPRPPGGPTQPGPAVWVGDRIVVAGGVVRGEGSPSRLSGQIWISEPSLTEDENLF